MLLHSDASSAGDKAAARGAETPMQEQAACGGDGFACCTYQPEGEGREPDRQLRRPRSRCCPGAGVRPSRGACGTEARWQAGAGALSPWPCPPSTPWASLVGSVGQPPVLALQGRLGADPATSKAQS
uniref:Uncharacterized protein n=1 Tax=Chrysemys picta bellii TaxID=8478 RepID=A0A8C3IWZ6_CHRPI